MGQLVRWRGDRARDAHRRRLPVCDSETGQQVRAGIAGEGLVVSIIATVLPFLVMVGVVAVVQLGGPRAKPRRLDGR